MAERSSVAGGCYWYVCTHVYWSRLAVCPASCTYLLVVWCASCAFAAAQRAAKDNAPATSQAPARRLSDGTSSAADEFCATFLEAGPLGLNLTSSDDGCGTMILAIQQGSQAENHPELVPGLVLTAVGSTLVAGRAHEAVTRAIVGHAERPLMLRFTRPNPNSTAAPPPISKALPPPPLASDAPGMGGGGGGGFSEYDSPGAAARARTPPRVRPGSPVRAPAIYDDIYDIYICILYIRICYICILRSRNRVKSSPSVPRACCWTSTAEADE